MNAKILVSGIAVAVMAAASVSAQPTSSSPDDMATMDHNQSQTPSTVPNTGPGSPRVGAAATAPVVNNAGSSDVSPDDAGRMRGKAMHNASQTPSTVPGASGTPKVGATATAPVVNGGGPPQ